jgi:hypothetical protein
MTKPMLSLLNTPASRESVAILSLVLVTGAAAGQSAPLSAGQLPATTCGTNAACVVPPPVNPWRMGGSLNYSFVAGSDASFQGGKSSSDAQSVNASASAEIPLNDPWFLPLRLTYHHLTLGTVADVPIPDQINTLGFDVGLGYRLDQHWTITASAGPRLYRLSDIGGADIGAGGLVMAIYKFAPNLTFAGGLNYETDRNVPVLPAAGLQWDIHPDLTLDLMFPTTALIYHVDRQLDLFVGAFGNFTVFRADANLGSNIGQPAFNHGLGTYRDFELGPGVEYRFWKGLSLEVQGGYSVGRQIDYQRLDQTINFKASPCVQTALRWRF